MRQGSFFKIRKSNKTFISEAIYIVMEGVKIGLGVENTTMTIVRCVPYVFHVYFKCLQMSKVRYTHEIHMKYT